MGSNRGKTRGVTASSGKRVDEISGNSERFVVDRVLGCYSPDGMPRASEDDEVESEPTPTTAATHSIVQQGSAGMMAANVVYSPPPEYPAAASEARVQGEVTVRAVVDPEGNVIYARAVSGPTLLRDAALEALQRWRYRPLLYYGKPIAVTTTAILDFKFAK